MNKFIIAAIAVASCSLIASATVKAGSAEYWDDAFAPGSNLPQICMAIGCVDENLCFIAGGSNGVGFGIYSYDGQLNGQVAQMNMNNQSMIVVSVEASGTAANPKGASGGVGTFFTSGFAPEHYYDAANQTWYPSSAPAELAIATPSISASGQTVVALDGGEPAGLLISQDGAQTYTLKSINGYPSPNLGNCSTANYIEVVGPNSWFILLGQEPQTPSSSSSAASSSFDVAGRRTIRHKNRDVSLDVTSGSVRVESIRAPRADPTSGVASGETCVGYSYQLIKTTDGGNTYTNLMMQSNASFTFYTIDCLNATHCVMVGGNQIASVVYMTKDGSTFTEVFSVDGTANGTVLFNDVAYANATDIWVGAELGDSQTQTAIGVFYYSRDGGHTWFEYNNLQYAVATIMSISFPTATVGFATGITQEQSSSILKYAPQPYMGYFAQKQCISSTCNVLCEEAYFPQSLCMLAQNGSMTATCTADGLLVKSYVTTSCVGAFNSSTAPINTCLESNNGGPLAYFENICDVDAIRKTGAQRSKTGAKPLQTKF